MSREKFDEMYDQEPDEAELSQVLHDIMDLAGGEFSIATYPKLDEFAPAGAGAGAGKEKERSKSTTYFCADNEGEVLYAVSIRNLTVEEINHVYQEGEKQGAYPDDDDDEGNEE